MITNADFKLYPTEIIGINSDYDLELQAMELSAIEMLEYSGDIKDVREVIIGLVFVLFWNARSSKIVAEVGETATVKEFTANASIQRDTVIYLTRLKLRKILDEKGTTANMNVFKLFYNVI